MVELNGEPMFIRPLKVLDRSPLVETIVLVFLESLLESARQIIAKHHFTKLQSVVPGGARRQDSVQAGLHALEATGKEYDLFMVHDAARPFLTEALIERGVATALAFGAAIPAIPVTETIKVVATIKDTRFVTKTLDRAALFAVQTPQVFRRPILTKAYKFVTDNVTDEASLVEQIGEPIAIFDGAEENFKITTPSDLHRVKASVGNSATAPVADSAHEWRWGQGFDMHRVVAGGVLRLGGIDLPFDGHLEGHSDGDVLLHAIASAILGGSGSGDLGQHFPSSDQRWKGVDSVVLVKAAIDIAQEKTWNLVAIDTTVIAQRPRLAQHQADIRAALASILALDHENVNVKVTSTDGLGIIGSGKCIATEAMATMRRSTAT